MLKLDTELVLVVGVEVQEVLVIVEVVLAVGVELKEVQVVVEEEAVSKLYVAFIAFCLHESLRPYSVHRVGDLLHIISIYRLLMSLL